MSDQRKRKPEIFSRRAVLVAAVLVMAALTGCASFQDGKQNRNETENAQTQRAVTDDAAVSVTLPEIAPAQDAAEVDSSKEIVKDVLLSNVPKADFSFSFNGKLTDAAVVTRAGDEGGFNQGTYPEQTETVSPMFIEGVEGEAVYLDGSYGVELLGVDALSDSYTISFWFRAEELRDWSPFLLIGANLLNAEGNQSLLSFNKKTMEEGTQVVPVFNTIDAAFDNSCEVRPSMEDKRCISLNEWNYITVCVDASQESEEDSSKVMGYLYVNSEMVGSGWVSKLHLEEQNVNAYLGISCFDEMFRAGYDEVHIWKYVLDENQISSMYTAYLGAG